MRASTEEILREEREEFDLEYSRTSPAQRWFEIRVRSLRKPAGGAAVMRFDVTARRQAETAVQRHLSELAHVDRVAGMGQLASSIAHELNQPLTAILTNAQAALRMLGAPRPDIEELGACLGDVVDDNQRAAEVIRRMRSLLMKTEFRRLPITLNNLVTNTISLVAHDAPPPRPGRRPEGWRCGRHATRRTSRSACTTRARASPRLISLGSSSTSSRPSRMASASPWRSATIVEAHGGCLLAENDPAGGATFRLHLPDRQPDATTAS